MKIRISYNLDDDYAELEDIETYLNYAEDDLGDAKKSLNYHKDLAKRLEDIIADIKILKADIMNAKEELEDKLAKEAREEIAEREREYWKTQF